MLLMKCKNKLHTHINVLTALKVCGFFQFIDETMTVLQLAVTGRSTVLYSISHRTISTVFFPDTFCDLLKLSRKHMTGLVGKYFSPNVKVSSFIVIN